MKVTGREKKFIVIGENIHTTRIVLRNGKRVATNPGGQEAIRYATVTGADQYLAIPEEVRRTQDYEEGRIKHVKLAIRAAMSGQEPEATRGMEYLREMARRQVEAGANFLDLNVDEISLRPLEQREAMHWLVQTIQEMCSVPLSVDSSNVETIQSGLEACDSRCGKSLLNSASLERLEALDLARKHDTQVIVTAAGEKGMPQNDSERVSNVSRMVEAALSKGISIQDIYIDALVFPISVDTQFGHHFFDAVRELRARYGPEIHITGGLSNVSFGLPARRLINDVFTLLAMEAGADCGIVDPISSNLQKLLSMDRQSRHYQMAEDLLLGRDRNCKNFLRAYRKGELS